MQDVISQSYGTFLGLFFIKKYVGTERERWNFGELWPMVYISVNGYASDE